MFKFEQDMEQGGARIETERDKGPCLIPFWEIWLLIEIPNLPANAIELGVRSSIKRCLK